MKKDQKKNKQERQIKNDQDQVLELKKLIEKLEQELKEKNQLVNDLEIKNEKLQNEIKIINQDYVQKLSSKMQEANQLLQLEIAQNKKKAEEEIALIRKYAPEKFADQLIDVINDFENALSFTSSDPKIASYQNGFKMFLNMFKNILNENHITEIVVNEHDEYNPEIMECFEIEHVDQYADNVVSKVLKKGYKLHERVIKHVLVKVNKLVN